MNIKKIITRSAETAWPFLRSAAMLLVLLIVGLLAIPTFSRSVAKDVLGGPAVTKLCQQSKACISGSLLTFRPEPPYGLRPVIQIARAESDKSEFRNRELIEQASYVQRYFLKYGRYEFKVVK